MTAAFEDEECPPDLATLASQVAALKDKGFQPVSGDSQNVEAEVCFTAAKHERPVQSISDRPLRRGFLNNEPLSKPRRKVRADCFANDELGCRQQVLYELMTDRMWCSAKLATIASRSFPPNLQTNQAYPKSSY